MYADTGSQGTVLFTVHNNGPQSKRIKLALEFEDDVTWSAELPTNEVELKAYTSAEVPLEYRVPSEGTEWTCYVHDQ